MGDLHSLINQNSLVSHNTVFAKKRTFIYILSEICFYDFIHRDGLTRRPNFLTESVKTNY